MPPPFSSYPSRTNTWAAGDPVASADLNAIQDGVIAVSENLDDLAAKVVVGATATKNTTDSPAPDDTGAYAVWFEATTAGTTAIVLDSSIDWRDRMIILTAYQTATATDVPGGATDGNTHATLSAHLHWIFFSGAGKTSGSTTATNCVRVIMTTDYFFFAVRSTDGALCLWKSADADGALTFVGEARCSPVQNHY